MKLAIVIGAVRQNRQSPKMAKWVYNSVKEELGVEAEIVDLADFELPIFDEEASPRYNPKRTVHPSGQKWLETLAKFDAYIFVTAEYNHSVPGVLKNAIDYIDWQLHHKPAMVVAHGSAGGARAEVALKEMLSESRAVLVPTTPGLTIFGMSEKIDENGDLSEQERANQRGPQFALKTMFAELYWFSDALAAARAKDT
jgi:NAD(P)H-dependent FMN reductase